MEDFDRLLAEAHRHHIKIVMDLVVNHTSDEHAWFIESAVPKTTLIVITTSERPEEWKRPNNWGACFGGSAAWEFDERMACNYLLLLFQKQPDLNWENLKVRDGSF